jgi:CHAT domain-containing protein
LHWNEFEDEQFTQAGVLHLAIPCVMDLRQPEESRLLLSDNLGEAEKGFLQPADIAGKSFQARLVVLSACEFSGSSPSAFDTNTRFTREFLQAGAGSVIASLWSVGDERAAEFWQRFYQAIVSNGDVSEALYQTKQSFIGTSELEESGVWAAFQLFK